MELTDALHIALRPAGVAQALCDSTLVRASLENCDSFTRLPSGEYAVILTVPVGPLRARYDVRARVASTDAPPGLDAVPGALYRTVNFKATAASVGALRGQVEIVLGNGVRGGEPDGTEANETRVDYAIWATLTGPLAELPPRQIEQALHALAEDFFTEFAAVVEAKHGKRPNRAQPGEQARRQHVFLRPISLAGQVHRPPDQDEAGATGTRAGAALSGHRHAHGRRRGDSPPIPPWLWAIIIVAAALLLYLFHRLQ